LFKQCYCFDILLNNFNDDISGETQHFNKDFIFKGSKWSISHIVLAVYQGNWAYGGYGILNYGMEDIKIKDFKRTVPRAVLIGLFGSAFVYVLTNAAYFTVLTPKEMLESSAVATTFAQKTVGSLSYAMPALIALLMTVLAMAFCLIGDVYVLVSYLTITAVAATMFSVGALVFIKWKKIPVSANAVKFPIFFPILNLIIIIALLLIPVIVEPIKSAVGFALFILGIGKSFFFSYLYPSQKDCDSLPIFSKKRKKEPLI
uniref:Amino acid permease n=1 Tax=Angiostrongylus cantonensis TaxID=6313 RepID=A0A0K0D0R5_ANGCA